MSEIQDQEANHKCVLLAHPTFWRNPIFNHKTSFRGGMTSPQLEDGFVRIANELYDQMVKAEFSKRQYKILLFVMRKTYGFNKKFDTISLSQFMESTGLDRANVSRTVNELVAAKVLLKQQHSNSQTLGVNKHYEEWSVAKTTTPQVLPKQQRSVAKTTTKVLPKQQPQKTRKTIQKTNTRKFDIFYANYPKKRGRETAYKSWQKLNPDESLMDEIMSALERQKISIDWLKDGGKFIPYPATWLNQKRWQDEVELPRQRSRLVL